MLLACNWPCSDLLKPTQGYIEDILQLQTRWCMSWLLQESGISNREQCQECCRMAQVEHNIVIAICTSLDAFIESIHTVASSA